MNRKNKIDKLVKDITMMVDFLSDLASDDEYSLAESSLEHIRNELNNMTGMDEILNESND